MNRDIESASDWHREFDRIDKSVTKALSLVEELCKKPAEGSETLPALDHELRSIKQEVGNLRWYFCGNPSHKWLAGQELTREEFYLLAAQGIIRIPSESGLKEAYKEFVYYLYEDDQRICYINPSEQPVPPWEVRLQIGIVPEEVRESFLRPAQLDFFKKYRPKLFSRFRKD